MKVLLASLFMLFAAEGQLADPQEETRAQDLMREIRCVACENEPISNSGSDIAADMRDRVRVLVAEGKSNEEIRDWFAERYGEFVLFRPSAEGPGGVLLWGLPFALLLAGGALIFVLRRRSAGGASRIDPVKPEEI
ncbi:MAG: cytochrome c-type biogenesis protein [Henriciella sp.]|uniref:cytochrome c-type biogenesis protein n=1 Tax=Henriciella sp. TaxID=1968823 RepID=UPI003C775E12